MKNLKNKILIALIFTGIFTMVGMHIAHATQLPLAPAVFETSLAFPIGVTDTSLTLALGTTTNGYPLNGFVCLTVDTSQVNLEYICGDATSTSPNVVNNLIRGVNTYTGTTSQASLIFSHRRGADVRITNFPLATLLQQMLSGITTIDNILKYSSSISTSSIAADRNNIASAGLVADTAFNGAGIINATTNAKGVVQLATGVQVASSTATCSSGAACVIQASSATSTWSNITLAALKIPVANNIGKIDSKFISTSTIDIPPVGSIIMYGTSTPPDGYLLANGQSVSSTTYATLYARYGDFYGTTTTGFKLPFIPKGPQTGSTRNAVFDNYARSPGVTSATSETFSFTNTNANLLVVNVMLVDVVRPTGVTYNGISLTLATTSTDFGNAITESQWYLVNPTTGTNNVVINWSGSHAETAVATSFHNVRVTPTPLEATSSVFMTSTASTSLFNLTTTQDNDLFVMGIYHGNIDTIAPTGWEKIVWSNNSNKLDVLYRVGNYPSGVYRDILNFTSNATAAYVVGAYVVNTPVQTQEYAIIKY